MAKPINKIEHLAIFGNKPAFPTPLHVGKPSLVDRESFLKKVNGILDREYYTNSGPLLAEFEESIATTTDVKHCVAVCNGTKALEIATRALGLAGEVIVPSFTFIATAHALQWQGITPVFCDIEADTHQIDIDQIERLITPETTGIMAVHLWGNCCNIEDLEKLSRKHNLRLVFDASHAFGSTYKGRSIGSFGDVEAVSFHATKMVQSFEGGAILTNNDELAEKARLMTNFGFVNYDEVASIGTNGKLSEVHAAMGLCSLQYLDATLDTFKQRHDHYQKLFSHIDNVRLVPQRTGSNHQYVVIEITQEIPGVRDSICRTLQEEGIIARRYFFPGCHNMSPYNTFEPRSDLPVTDEIASKVIVLPSGPAVTNDDIDKIAGIIAICMDNIHAIVQKIGGNMG